MSIELGISSFGETTHLKQQVRQLVMIREFRICLMKLFWPMN